MTMPCQVSLFSLIIYKCYPRYFFILLFLIILSLWVCHMSILTYASLRLISCVYALLQLPSIVPCSTTIWTIAFSHFLLTLMESFYHMILLKSPSISNFNFMVYNFFNSIIYLYYKFYIEKCFKDTLYMSKLYIPRIRFIIPHLAQQILQ